MSPDLTGRNILITGASEGIGRAVAGVLAAHGSHVIASARRPDVLEAAVAELPGSGHLALRIDVADQKAWPTALRAVDEHGPLHGVVMAAGALGPIGPLEDVAPGEIERTLAINLMGTMLALHHCLPRLRRTRGRAVTFSGGGGTAPLPRYDTYAVSKAAVVRLTENVAAAYDGQVEVNCVAPGFVATRMHEGTLSAGPGAAGADYYQRTLTQLRSGGVPAQEAAELVCFLLSSEAAGISGRLLSAQWDPWRDSAFRARLRSDMSLGTLRRIDGSQFGQIS